MSDLSATNCGCGCDADRFGGGCGNNNNCGCGFGNNSCLWIILLLCCCGGCGNNNGCGCGNDSCLWIILLWNRMLLIHPSHCFRYDSGWSLYSISFFMYISTLFLIYIYNVKGRNCHGKENTQIIAAVR